MFLLNKLELYSYLLLVGYIIVAILLSGLWAQSKGLSPQIGAKIAAEYTAIPFLAWIILTAYYSVRWLAGRARKRQPSAA